MRMPDGQKYITDDKGAKIAVILDIHDYESMLREIEELESIRSYDAAVSDPGETIPFAQAIGEIEESRG